MSCEETHVPTKQKTLLERGCRVREPRRSACQVTCSLKVYGSRIGFPDCLCPVILLAPIFGLTQGPSWWYIHLSAKIDSSVRVTGQDCYGLESPSFWPLPNSPSQFLGGSTKFLIGTSCCETTHPSGYHHAWPRWAALGNDYLTPLFACLCLFPVPESKINRKRNSGYFVPHCIPRKMSGHSRH